MVELVDTQDLGSCAFGCEGSSPSFGTLLSLLARIALLGTPSSSLFAKAPSLIVPSIVAARSNRRSRELSLLARIELETQFALELVDVAGGLDVVLGHRDLAPALLIDVNHEG